MKQKLHASLLLWLCFTVAIVAQNISGKVVDDEGIGLIGATVLVKGTTIGTVTDIDGAFDLKVPKDYNTVVISYTGYQSQEFDITDKKVLDVILAPDSELLDEVVVVGYGRQKKSVVTGAISTIDMKDIESLSSAQLQTSLQGRTAGVTILPNSGSPGAGFKVRVRGTGSNGNSDPLYIVDGMRTRDISFLTSEEIESLEVLKDGATAAIYGAEGGNGVIIVTTKRGGSETAGVTYTTQFGTQSYQPNFDLMTADQHLEYMNEAGLSGATGGTTTNWLDEVFETAPLQRHSLSFNGGNENTNYYLQGSIFNQDGIVVGDRDRFKRFALRANVDNQVKNWLKVGVSLNYSHSNRRGISEDQQVGGTLANAIMMDPSTPVSYTGTLPDFAQNLADSTGINLLTDENGNYYGLSQFVAGEIYNPVADISRLRGQGTTTDRVFGSLYGRINFTPNISFTSRIGINNDFTNFHAWTPSFYFTGTRQNGDASVQQTQTRGTAYQWENFVNYEQSLGTINLGVVLGTSAYQQESTGVVGLGTGVFREIDAFGYLNAVQPGNEFTTANGFNEKSRLLSMFGRVNVDIAEKYLLSATMRRDGSSLLSNDNRWGTFPSVSAGWVVSREDFFPSSNAFSFMKVRASWGRNGSLANLRPGQWNSAIVFTNTYPDGNENPQIAAEPNILANPDLTWETSEQIDIGVDFGFLDDRLTLTFDWFDKQTKDLLFIQDVPDYIGNAPPFFNLGDISNKGFEIELGYRNRLGNGLNYDLSANYTRLSNEVTALAEGIDFVNAANARIGVSWDALTFEAGQPAWYYRGYQTDGIFQSQTEVDDYLNQIDMAEAPIPGDVKVVDVNGDGAITPDDQTFIGSPHPDGLYGLRLGADFKGLDFAFFLQGTIGNDILLGYIRTDRPTANRPSFFYDDRWSESNTDGTWFRADGANNFAYTSDFMVFDGSYTRIKQIQVGYTLDLEKVAPNFANIAKSARLYVSLEDFFTFTNYQGLDPEAGSANDGSLGVDRGVYPLPRKLLGGLSVRF